MSGTDVLDLPNQPDDDRRILSVSAPICADQCGVCDFCLALLSPEDVNRIKFARHLYDTGALNETACGPVVDHDDHDDHGRARD